MSDTPYYLLDATVREARGAPLGRMSSFDGALDTAMWVFDTLRLDALCSAVARVAEAKGRAECTSGVSPMLLDAYVANGKLCTERDALRETVARLTRADTDALTAEILATDATDSPQPERDDAL